MTDIDNLRKPVTHLKMVKQDDGYEVAFCPRCEKAAEEIERLRRQVSLLNGHDTLAQLEAHIDEQAAEIERLRNLIIEDAATACSREIAKDEEIERLRAELRRMEVESIPSAVSEGRKRVAELEALLDEKSAKLAKSWEKQLNKTYEVEQIRSELMKADAEIERLRSSLILIRRAIEHLPAESIISKIDGLAKTALERKDD